MTALTKDELNLIKVQTKILERHTTSVEKLQQLFTWVKHNMVSPEQHHLLCRFILEPQPVQRVALQIPYLIVTTKDGVEVFRSERGDRPVDYPLRDYTCFGSPIIGAAYHHYSWDDIAKRIKQRGYNTTFHYETQTGI